MDTDAFEEKVRSLFHSEFKLRDFLVKSGEYRSLTTIGRFSSERYPDQWLEAPREGWELVLLHSEGETVHSFSFDVPRPSDKIAFTTRWVS